MHGLADDVYPMERDLGYALVDRRLPRLKHLDTIKVIVPQVLEGGKEIPSVASFLITTSRVITTRAFLHRPLAICPSHTLHLTLHHSSSTDAYFPII
jgi:hypothetical protein